MSFLDIKDPAERVTLVNEYVTAMKTVKQRNMANRELKLAIGDELQTLFHPIVNATNQAAEETRRELEPMKKTLADIDGALKPVAAPQPSKNVDTTFGIYSRKDGQLQMGSEIVGLNENTLTVGDTEYDLTPGLHAFIMQKHPQVSGLVMIIEHINLFLHRPRLNLTRIKRGSFRPRATWKYKHMLRRMTVLEENIPEEEEGDTDGTDTNSMGDSGDILSTYSGILSPEYISSSSAHTRPYGKARKTKDRGAFYKGYKGEGVVYLPGDINGLAKKLQLLAAEFFAGNTTVRNELGYTLA